MKNVTVTSLSRPILVIELSEGLSQMRKNTLSSLNHDGWVLLGKPDEIQEEYARLYVQKTNTIFGKYESERWFKNYKDGGHFLTALESFFSALENEIYWENPYRDVSKNFYDLSMKSQKEKYNRDYHNFWDAKSRTFDKQRTFIFVKN